MGKIFCIITIICLTGAFHAETFANNTTLLTQLDHVVRSRERYRRVKENQINALKNELQQAATDKDRFDIYTRLYKAWAAYQTDSALRYIAEKKALLPVLADENLYYDVEIDRINMMMILGMFKDAFDILKQVPENRLSGDVKTQYMLCCRTLYGHRAKHTVMKEEQELYLKCADNYRNSLLAILPPDGADYLIVKAERFNAHGQYDEAIRLLKDVTDTCTDIEKVRFYAYTLSDSYRQKDDTENRKRYLILSAMADLRSAIKEYVALRELASLLFDEGDINKAYEYIKCSLEDTAFCNARSRAIEIAEIFPMIDKAYQLKTVRKKQLIYALFFATSFLALCLMVMVIHSRRQVKNLAVARKSIFNKNKQLQQLNRVLTETNVIKEKYIAQYIHRCSAYIDKMDAYRRNLAKLASRSKLEELFRAIKSESPIDKERMDFFKEFDDTFLGIFPGFVKSFNELLNEKDRIYPKRNELLNTELRIFALIRLGITDSTHIAEFLQYSITTIYNYRSKIRNKATGDKNEFESKVMVIV
jgi:hypothetical protein